MSNATMFNFNALPACVCTLLSVFIQIRNVVILSYKLVKIIHSGPSLGALLDISYSVCTHIFNM
uniref:Putative ovule protein n=1 Tax=Solanum chacoense TaxID=4108 RepID=A0A0V0HR41_SOLCH